MIEADNKTIWCGNLPEQVTEEILYELFLQAGPLEKVRIARDRDGRPKNFAFITYNHEVSVPYAINLFRGTTLFNRTLSMQHRGRMALLPPPIRCYGPDQSVDFSNQQNVVQQFANMTENLQTEQYNEAPRHRDNDKLTMASLQGNWTHRHHPYRAKETTRQGNRDRDYRPRDVHEKHHSRGQSSGNWRDRRHQKKSYHRRD
ncbi:RNA-binding protein 7 [Epargyreus clarus]|uniref:RNA-binding protein 7 n=1 Tax=Epargyreus clarus TaxID=520877 RepID=UPI003C2B7284